MTSGALIASQLLASTLNAGFQLDEKTDANFGTLAADVDTFASEAGERAWTLLKLDLKFGIPAIALLYTLKHA